MYKDEREVIVDRIFFIAKGYGLKQVDVCLSKGMLNTFPKGRPLTICGSGGNSVVGDFRFLTKIGVLLKAQRLTFYGLIVSFHLVTVPLSRNNSWNSRLLKSTERDLKR